MFYYTYVLQSSKNKKHYVGFSEDLVKRIKEHRLGCVDATRSGRPWTLIYYEACRNKLDAIQREKQLKTGFGRAYLKRRINDSA